MQLVRIFFLVLIFFWLLTCFFLTCQVNSYPTVRGFTAIGTGGDDFVQAMVFAVESVIQQPIPEVPIPIFIGKNHFLINALCTCVFECRQLNSFLVMF